MKNSIILFMGIIIILTLGLCGCNQEVNEDKLIGGWEGTFQIAGNDISIQESYVFYENNTFTITTTYGSTKENKTGIWSFNDDKLILDTDDNTITTDYQFSNNDQTLRITGINNNEITLSKN